jgi:integrase/recombinase XerD
MPIGALKTLSGLHDKPVSQFISKKDLDKFFMQHHTLTSTTFNLYVLRFEQWLHTLGYSPSTVRNYPSILREFLHYCQGKAITEAQAIEKETIAGYLDYIGTRKNHRREGALSATYINSHIRMLQLFGNWLKQTLQLHLPLSEVSRVEEEKKTGHVILTTGEVRQLYQLTDDSPRGMRDRAMLAVYYGCGLRKSEGVYLDVSDVLFERKLLYIRKAKNNYERYVPITKSNLQHLEQWVNNARNLLLSEHSKEDALFISERGNRIDKQTMYLRLKALQRQAGIQKEIGLHTLRHSIATHLLQRGMALENIALFLGHRCLDSTQVYTHILNETL